MIGSKISAIEYFLPKKKEDNKIFKKNNPKVNIERIKEKTGINNRFISSENETVIAAAGLLPHLAGFTLCVFLHIYRHTGNDWGARSYVRPCECRGWCHSRGPRL